MPNFVGIFMMLAGILVCAGTGHPEFIGLGLIIIAAAFRITEAIEDVRHAP